MFVIEVIANILAIRIVVLESAILVIFDLDL